MSSQRRTAAFRRFDRGGLHVVLPSWVEDRDLASLAMLDTSAECPIADTYASADRPIWAVDRRRGRDVSVIAVDRSDAPFVNRGMSASCEPSSSRIPREDGFASFFDDALPVVFGYALRLCGGDRDEAWDVTQDAWLTFVREVNRNPSELPSIAWLVRVARSRFLDRWRRTHKLPDRLRLVWAADRGNDTTDVERDVLPCLARLRPAHRIVLTLFYIDDLPVAEVGRLMGLSRSGTYSVLGRAREELRTKLMEVSDV